MRAPEDPAPAAWSGPQRAWAYALLALLAALLALWGSFLVPFRVGAAVVPVSWGVALVGNLALGRAGAQLAGSTGALVPGVLWLAVALPLSFRRAEGDLVVVPTTVGVVFLLAGALASAVAYALAPRRPRSAS